MKMTESQLRRMIEFHTKAERAYIHAGKLRDARQARRWRLRLEKELKERFGI